MAIARDCGAMVPWWRSTRATARPACGRARTTRLVADAGFDEFLRLHWSVLLARQQTPVRFAVPALARALDFDVRSLGGSSIGARPMQAFQLRLGGPLALISPRIDVAYDARTRRLRRYRGVTNIRSDQGKRVAATIDFPDPPREVATAAWESALSQPLARCKVGT